MGLPRDFRFLQERVVGTSPVVCADLDDEQSLIPDKRLNEYTVYTRNSYHYSCPRCQSVLSEFFTQVRFVFLFIVLP